MTGAWVGYFSILEAATASRLSERTIRRGLRDPKTPLRHFRVGRRVLIARDDLQQWIESHAAVVPPASAERVLSRLSPTARALLDGILSTPAAPERSKRRNSNA